MSCKKVLFLVNHDVVIYNFRLELVERLLFEKFEVFVSSPYGERIDDLLKLGCHWLEIKMDRHGRNPLQEIKLICEYDRVIKKVKPDYILGYTVKPNIYGAMVAAKYDIPFIANITGLGAAIENGGLLQKITLIMYKLGLRKAKKVFFQNSNNREFMLKHRIINIENELLPGSGVNLMRNSYINFPNVDKIVRFVCVSRIQRDKGLNEYLDMAETIKADLPNTEFHIVGWYDEADLRERVERLSDKGIIIFQGRKKQEEVHEIVGKCNCLIHASYHEGMANVLLEAAATGRPVIATDIPGCRETFEDGLTGFACRVRDSQSLIEAVRKFLALSISDQEEMGRRGREKIEKEFDRNIIVQAYMEEINR